MEIKLLRRNVEERYVNKMYQLYVEVRHRKKINYNIVKDIIRRTVGNKNLRHVIR